MRVDHRTAVADYLRERGIKTDQQIALGLKWISYAEATSDRYGFGQQATSPDGLIAFPLDIENKVFAAKNWYVNSDSVLKHLARINKLRLRQGLTQTDHAPKYLLPKGDRAKDLFYDPYALLHGKTNGKLPDILFATEDVVGCIKAAEQGFRVVSSFGVWLVLRQAMENLQADMTWLHPLISQIPAYILDSDALEKPSVLQAGIRTGYVIQCPICCFPLTHGKTKIGLDEYLDEGGDLEKLVEQAKDVGIFVQESLPMIHQRLKEQGLPLSIAANKAGIIYEAAIRELAKHVTNIAAFRLIYGPVLKQLGFNYSEWRPIYLSVKPSRELTSSPRLLAKALTEGPLKQRLLFESKLRGWYVYNPEQGYWEQVQKETVSSLVDRSIEQLIASADFEHGLKENTIKFLRDRVEIKQWPIAPKLINFINGALDTSDESPCLLDHAPSHHLTYCLPRTYCKDAETQTPIIDTFQESLTGGSEGEVNKLNCFAAAVLRGMVELQVYQALIGPPGCGKGTWVNFLIELVGIQASYSTDLTAFCGTQFDAGNCYGKRLVIFNDADQYSGGLSKFLNFTGGDQVRGEIKGGASFNFKAEGFIVITANRPVFVRSHPGLNRRTILVRCEKQKIRKTDTTILARMCGELESYTAKLLQIPKSKIIDTLLKKGGNHSHETLQHWQHLCETDAIAAWAEESLVEGQRKAIDKDSNYMIVGASKNDPTSLYGSYVMYCHQTGRSPKALNSFVSDLMTLLTEVLEWDVEHKRVRLSNCNKPSSIVGIKKRAADQRTISECIDLRFKDYKDPK